MDNCRAWYSDVCSAPSFTNFWGDVPSDPNANADEAASKAEKDEEGKYKDEKGQKVPPQPAARAFLSGLQVLQQDGKGDREGLEKKSREEIEALVEFCKSKFGTEKMDDARDAYVKQSEEIKSMSEDMVSGKGGYRKF